MVRAGAVMSCRAWSNACTARLVERGIRQPAAEARGGQVHQHLGGGCVRAGAELTDGLAEAQEAAVGAAVGHDAQQQAAVAGQRRQ